MHQYNKIRQILQVKFRRRSRQIVDIILIEINKIIEFISFIIEDNIVHKLLIFHRVKFLTNN